MTQDDLNNNSNGDVPPKNLFVGPDSDVSRAISSGQNKELVGPGDDDYGRNPQLDNADTKGQGRIFVGKNIPAINWFSSQHGGPNLGGLFSK